MQSAAVQQRVFTGAAVRAAPAKPRATRAAVVVRASAKESRRAVLGGLVAGFAALTASAANAIDLVDDRKAREKGFDIIYEARDLDLPQNVREGFTQARQDIASTKKRLAESERRIDSELEGPINKAYWTEAREQLRRQVGYLSFDINVLADNLAKPAKKEALAAKKVFVSAVNDLDFALRKKDGSKAIAALKSTQSALDSVIAKLG
eukprot:scaffold17.g481.t1